MRNESRFKIGRTRRLTIIAIAAALCTVTNYLLLPVQNVKPMDLIVFITGYLAGPVAGAVTGILGWSLYGTINPNGFNLYVWIATSLGETLYGVAGGLLGLKFRPGRVKPARDAFLLGMLALALTFAYDIFTTFVAAFASGLSNNPEALALTFALAIPWFIAHEAGNLLIFSSSAVPVIRPLDNLFGRRF